MSSGFMTLNRCPAGEEDVRLGIRGGLDPDGCPNTAGARNENESSVVRKINERMFIRSSCLGSNGSDAKRVGLVVPAPEHPSNDHRSHVQRTWRWFRLLACVSLISVGAVRSMPGKEPSWQLLKIDGRDYLPLDNIARFYQLQGSTQMMDHRITLGDGRARLELGGNPHEVYVNGVKQWLSFPVLIQNDQVMISRFDLAKTIDPSLRPSMIANLSPFRTVILDAGHGGKDRGASSRVGVEKEYTLDVCHDLKKALEAMGLHVVVTRDGDQFLPLEERADLANGISDAIFVSLHFNSASDGGRANGFEVYAMTPQGAASTADTAPSLEQFEEVPGNEFDNASLALATCVQHSILGHIPQVDRGVRRARFAVLRLTRAPAILVEGGFLTNDQESRSINDPAWRERLAEAIAQGVESFQEVAVFGKPPKLLADYRSEQLPMLGTIVNPAGLTMRSSDRAGALRKVAASGVTPVRSGGGFPSVN